MGTCDCSVAACGCGAVPGAIDDSDDLGNAPSSDDTTTTTTVAPSATVDDDGTIIESDSECSVGITLPDVSALYILRSTKR